MKANKAPEQYISKSTLVEEIEKRKGMCDNHYGDYWNGCYNTFTDILSFINTLEVKGVEEPTASDRGMAEEIIINLKRVEQDYHIDLTKEMEWLRNKTQKG